jgi:protein O-GlcNAc transferase
VSAAEETFQKAIKAMNSGRPLEAEALFGKVLALKPNLAEAWLGRGNALAGLGRYDEALAAYRKAISLKPDLGGPWLGHLLSNMGRHEEALAAYDKALALKPGLTEALLGRCHSLVRLKRYVDALAAYDKSVAREPGLAAAWLGHLFASLDRHDEALAAYDMTLAAKPDLTEAWLGRGNILFKLGRFDDALAAYDRVLALEPGQVAAWLGRGNLLTELKRYDEAPAAYDKALALKPDLAEAWLGRGSLLVKLERYDEALAVYDKALALKPDLAEAWLSRGSVLTELQRYDEALAACEKALALRSDLPGGRLGLAAAWLGRGNSFANIGRFDEALTAYDKALALKPDLVGAWLGLGNTFSELERPSEALRAYDKALALVPDLAGAWLGRGNIFFKSKRFDDALAAYDEALAFDPGLAEAWLSRGLVLVELKRHDEVLAAYDKALVLKPDLVGLEGLRLGSKMLLCDWDNFDSDCSHLIESVRQNKLNTDPFSFLGVASLGSDQYNCAKQWISKRHPSVGTPAWKGEIYKHHKIRIGYVSADFQEHPVAFLTAGMFENHDKSMFDITAISLGPKVNTPMRRRLEGAFENFLDAGTLSDEGVAAKIRLAEIDILVDMMGFTKNARTNIFAHRPAPIQVNYLGYPGTIGAGYIDYIIGDPVVIPPSHQTNYAEKVVYLPHSYMPHDAASRVIPDRVFVRSECGLPEKGFVFCGFNNSYKLNPDLFRSWMSILKAVEGSVLWLSEANPQAVDNLRKEAVKEGVDPERLVFAKRLPNMEDHLARQTLANLFLDTLPYNAHATANDALWAGLPVLTQIGETFPGRVAASLLKAIDLPELIAATSDEYERLAIDLATHPERLAAIKQKLAKNRLTSPLFDTPLFVRHIEAAYTAMHDRYTSGLAPDHIAIAG